MPDKLTPAELAEGLRRLEHTKRGSLLSRGMWDQWINRHGETALRELAALRVFHSAVQEAALRYDDPRNAPPTAQSGLELFHEIDAALSAFAHQPPPVESRET